jgi:nitroreductase
MVDQNNQQETGLGHDGAVVLRALRERRSMPLMRAESPPRALIEQVIAAGTWGPNHHRTAPWRFVVLTGSMREALGEVMAASRAANLPDPNSEESRKLLAKERAKPLRAPVIVAAAAVPTGHPKAQELEEIAAVAAGVQNMLLAAEAVGLGAMWRTGRAAEDPAVSTFLRLPPGSHIVGFVYLGYPAVPHVPREGKDASAFITWLEPE